MIRRNASLYSSFDFDFMYQPGDWRSGQEPALPRSIRSEYFPILKKTPEKLEFLSSILDLSFCFFLSFFFPLEI